MADIIRISRQEFEEAFVTNARRAELYARFIVQYFTLRRSCRSFQTAFIGSFVTPDENVRMKDKPGDMDVLLFAVVRENSAKSWGRLLGRGDPVIPFSDCDVLVDIVPPTAMISEDEQVRRYEDMVADFNRRNSDGRSVESAIVVEEFQRVSDLDSLVLRRAE